MVFEKASNHLDEHSTFKNYNLTIISDGAFNSLPSLYRLDFEADVDLFDGVPFLGLNRLQKFWVHNGKQSILQKLFDAAPNLCEFRFGKNLEHLADNAFDGLTVINKINLNGNRLTSLGKAFHVLPHEVTCGMEVEFPYWFINLDNNNLGSINGVFENLQGLRGRISLEGNTNLSPLPILQEVLALDTMIAFKMSDKPLECGCNMKWLAADPKLKNLGYEWKCKNGEPLKYVSIIIIY